MPAISIIANFYNSEKYIDKLIKSVIAQTFTDWELIAVNDCSPGRDSVILHRWAQKDARIRVIDNPVNLGLARAKKVGIDAARGEYIAFVDGDDWFEKDAMEVLYNAATSTDADIVIMDYYRAYPLGIRRKISLNLAPADYNRRVEQQEFIDRFYINWLGATTLFSAYWNKFYRAAKLKVFNLPFASKEDTYAEDTNFSRHYLPTLESITFVPYAGYNWRHGGISSMSKPYEFHNADSIIRTYAKRYKDAQVLIDRYNVEPARATINHEAVSVITEVLERITYPLFAANASRSEIISAIEGHLLNAEICNNAELFKHNEQFPIMMAVRSKDADALCDIMSQRYNRQWKIRIARRLLSVLSR